MQIKTWMKDRQTTGTAADVARRMLENDPKLCVAEETFRKMCVLEAVFKNNWSLVEAADSLDVSLMTVRRTMRSMGFTAVETRRLASVRKKKLYAS